MNTSIIILIAASVFLLGLFGYCLYLIKHPDSSIDVLASNRQTLLSFDDNQAIFQLELTTSIGELEDVIAYYSYDSNTFVLIHENVALDISSRGAEFIGAVMGWRCEHYNCSCKECSPTVDLLDYADNESFCLSS